MKFNHGEYYECGSNLIRKYWSLYEKLEIDLRHRYTDLILLFTYRLEVINKSALLALLGARVTSLSFAIRKIEEEFFKTTFHYENHDIYSQFNLYPITLIFMQL